MIMINQNDKIIIKTHLHHHHDHF